MQSQKAVIAIYEGQSKNNEPRFLLALFIKIKTKHKDINKAQALGISMLFFNAVSIFLSDNCLPMYKGMYAGFVKLNRLCF